jgi:DNA polymerase-3 subunit alpha
LSDFTHLHIHSEHSILDGFTTTETIPGIAAELGQSAIALSDHGTLGGALKFYNGALEHEVKPLFAVETYVTPDIDIKDKTSQTWHLILVATSRTGLENLFRMSKIAWTRGFYKKPRVDYAILDAHSEGIVALSACMASEICRAMEVDGDWSGKYEITPAAVEAADRYKKIYPGRFFIELQPGNTQHLNTTLAELASGTSTPTTVTVDSHYDHCSSKAVEELLLVMQQGSGSKASDKEYAKLMFEEARRESNLLSRLDKLWPNRGLSYTNHELHIMSRDEVVTKMSRQGFDGNALADSTLKIADRCENVELIKKGKVYIPQYDKTKNSDDLLRFLVMAGLKQRGLDKRSEYLERVEEELGIIKSKGFADYYLIVWDIYNEARSRGIYVGPGRGSMAGSLCFYALKVTALDPIRYKLLFFRFIDAGQGSFDPAFPCA